MLDVSNLDLILLTIHYIFTDIYLFGAHNSTWLANCTHSINLEIEAQRKAG